MTAAAPLIVGIGGTTRAGSTTELALLHALSHAEQAGCRTRAFGSAELPTEPYDPSNPDRSERALALVDALRHADGVLIATPCYHGGVSGLMKNAIDFAEDLRTDARPYLQGRAVGCIVCAEGPQAFGPTLSALRDIVHALRGWPTPYGAALNTTGRPFGPDGMGTGGVARQACERVAGEVMSFARLMAGAR